MTQIRPVRWFRAIPFRVPNPGLCRVYLKVESQAILSTINEQSTPDHGVAPVYPGAQADEGRGSARGLSRTPGLSSSQAQLGFSSPGAAIYSSKWTAKETMQRSLR